MVFSLVAATGEMKGTKTLFVAFIDLTKAFDRAVREFAMGWPQLNGLDKAQLLRSCPKLRMLPAS